MKLYVLSDVHVEFEPFDPPEVDADIVILAGDIHVKNKGLLWAQEKFKNIPVLYVLGNHEYYGEALPKHLEKLKEKAEGTNIKILENEAITIGGVTFLCCTLWTDFKLFGDARIAGYEATQVMTDYKKIRISPTYRKLRSIDTAGIHYKSINWLKEAVEKNQNQKLVIVTHHAPSRHSIPEHYREDILSAAYASDLDDFVANSGADVWIHGHLHTQKDYMIGNTRVLCNPRGYSDEPNEEFVPDMVLEI